MQLLQESTAFLIFRLSYSPLYMYIALSGRGKGAITRILEFDPCHGISVVASLVFE